MTWKLWFLIEKVDDFNNISHKFCLRRWKKQQPIYLLSGSGISILHPYEFVLVDRNYADNAPAANMTCNDNERCNGPTDKKARRLWAATNSPTRTMFTPPTLELLKTQGIPDVLLCLELWIQFTVKEERQYMRTYLIVIQPLLCCAALHAFWNNKAQGVCVCFKDEV